MVKLNMITIPTTGRTAFKDSANFCRIFGFNNFNIGLSFLLFSLYFLYLNMNQKSGHTVFWQFMKISQVLNYFFTPCIVK